MADSLTLFQLRYKYGSVWRSATAYESFNVEKQQQQHLVILRLEKQNE